MYPSFAHAPRTGQWQNSGHDGSVHVRAARGSRNPQSVGSPPFRGAFRATRRTRHVSSGVRPYDRMGVLNGSRTHRRGCFAPRDDSGDCPSAPSGLPTTDLGEEPGCRTAVVHSDGRRGGPDRLRGCHSSRRTRLNGSEPRHPPSDSGVMAGPLARCPRSPDWVPTSGSSGTGGRASLGVSVPPVDVPNTQRFGGCRVPGPCP